MPQGSSAVRPTNSPYLYLVNFSVPDFKNSAGTPPTPHDVLLFKDLTVILTISISKLILSISISFISSSSVS